MLSSRVLAAVLCCAPLLGTGAACGAQLSDAEIGEICRQAEDAAHCGRLVEGAQLKRLPNLAGDDRALMVAVAVKERDEDNDPCVVEALHGRSKV